MKKPLLFIAIISITLFSCLAGKNFPIVGNYDSQTKFESQKSFDEVWSNIIDLFAEKGIAIKVIDRSSGLIASEKTDFLTRYSFEEAGVLKKKGAWIVLSSIKAGGMEIKPQVVNAEWNIRIKKSSSGTIVNVNLVNIQASTYSPPGQYVAEHTYVFDGKSTGVFEKMIFDIIK